MAAQAAKQELFHRFFRVDYPKLAVLNREAYRSPRNGPIYYVLRVTLDHTEIRKNKTAGRRLADFTKTPLWSTLAGKT